MRSAWLTIWLCLFNGMVVADDLQKAAEQGAVDAQLEFGLKLLGDESPENDLDGMNWLETAASSGSIKARYNIGALYQDGVPAKGSPIKKDAYRALMHLNIAAELGEVRAMNRLAGIYFVGDITPQNDLLAVKWAVIAAGLENESAKKNLENLRSQVSQQNAVLGGRIAASWVEHRKHVLFPEKKK